MYRYVVFEHLLLTCRWRPDVGLAQLQAADRSGQLQISIRTVLRSKISHVLENIMYSLYLLDREDHFYVPVGPSSRGPDGR